MSPEEIKEIMLWIQTSITVLKTVGVDDVVKNASKEFLGFVKALFIKPSAIQDFEHLENNPQDKNLLDNIKKRLESRMEDEFELQKELMIKVSKLEKLLQEKDPQTLDTIRINIKNSKNILAGVDKIIIKEGDFRIGDNFKS